MKHAILEGALIGATILCITSGCSNRDRNNPFDPQNPITEGNPLELHAIPAVNYINLIWEFPDISDIESVRLLMSSPDTPTVVLRDDISQNGDLKVYFGTVDSDERSFWMELAVDGWSGIHTSDTTSAIFSSGECWIAHGYDDISLYSPEIDTYLPTRSLGTYLVDGCCSGSSLWMIGTPGGILYFVSINGEGISLDHSLSFGYALKSCDISNDGRLLISHGDGLIWYDSYWAETESWLIDIQSEIRYARLTPEDDGVWIWDESDSVSFIPAGEELPLNTWFVPDIIDLSPAFGRKCWIASENGVIYLNGNNGEMELFNFSCRSVAPASNDYCWISLPSDNKIVMIDRFGRVIRTIDTIDEPQELAHNPGTNVLWCGTYDKTLLKVLTDGRIASVASLPESPWFICTF